MVWYSHLFQNFPQFIVIHTVKGFGIVNKAEIDVSLELSCFLISALTIGDVHVWSFLLCCWKRVLPMTGAFSWKNSDSLRPAPFCTPRPNLLVTPGVS